MDLLVKVASALSAFSWLPEFAGTSTIAKANKQTNEWRDVIRIHFPGCVTHIINDLIPRVQLQPPLFVRPPESERLTHAFKEAKIQNVEDFLFQFNALNDPFSVCA